MKRHQIEIQLLDQLTYDLVDNQNNCKYFGNNVQLIVIYPHNYCKNVTMS